MSQVFSSVLPILALILALIVVAVLWYWWTSNQPEGEEPRPAPPDSEQTKDTPAAAFDGAARVSALLSGLKSSVSGLISGASAIGGPRTGGTTTSGETIEVLRLYRDLSNGALVVQIGRQRYYSLDEITEPQVRRRFLGNAEAVAQFAQLKKGTSPLIDWSAGSATVNQSRPAYPADAQGISASPVEAAPPPPPVSTPMPGAPRDPMAAQPFANKTETAQTGTAKKSEEPPPKSIADEIEELLQYRLALDPVFAQRSIHIRSAADGSIVVQVDDARFDGVGDVKDDDVRAFLQKVVQEWEARK